MLTIFFILAVIALEMVLAYLSVPVLTAAIAFAIFTLIAAISGVSGWLLLVLILACAALGVLSNHSIRKLHISRPIFTWFKNVLPDLSETEQEAIDAGTVWWDGDLFSGKPDWDKLLSNPLPTLTDEEQAFIDGPVQELCRMVDRWDINHNTSVIPKEITDFIHKKGFLGMIIPKEYGGLDFSAVAQTEILSLLGSTGGCVAYYIGVPNSLGPGELLIKYGTQKQRDFYLPRLAKGQELPCFALTGPLAGSDATAMPDTGVVCKGKYKGKDVLGIKINFNKRYITLAPIASLVGLAFRLNDPDHLIGETDEYGITCALIPRKTRGMTIGRRHLPIGDAFLNGPILGKNVFIPLDNIIGGVENAGKGWRMLVNCLSVGRCITLPSGSNACAQQMVLGTTAYASLRKQFGIPIKKFEGVQKPLARICGNAYIINAARLHTAQSLEMGEKPSVPSAILKYHCTEMARQTTLDAMDIHGGKAIMRGDKNYVADAYSSIPIAITVEGANIMTRNFMIFGQGATRSHPYVLREMELANMAVNDETTEEFDEIFFKHVGFTLTNTARAFVMGLTGSFFITKPTASSVSRYYQHLDRLSSAFALVADVTMLTLQSKLKFREMLSARLGDCLSSLYLASMVLKHFENRNCPTEERPLVIWSLDHLLHEYQVAMLEALQNYPNKLIAAVLKLLVFPMGARFNAPSDRHVKDIVKLMTTGSSAREELTRCVFKDDIPTNPLGHTNAVFMDSLAVEDLYQRMRAAVKAGEIPKVRGLELIKAASKGGVLSKAETTQLRKFDEKLMSVINVDDFNPSELIRVSDPGSKANAAAT
ncbi:MAG: acyl-CoA dehydrogenase [Proteobacteria bacterium]|jgi:acyl-CoA dehydrogenase|nr:acyl-CoA dehydrogenase [Pseudomonadota bacterium]